MRVATVGVGRDNVEITVIHFAVYLLAYLGLLSLVGIRYRRYSLNLFFSHDTHLLEQIIYVDDMYNQCNCII